MSKPMLVICNAVIFTDKFINNVFILRPCISHTHIHTIPYAEARHYALSNNEKWLSYYIRDFDNGSFMALGFRLAVRNDVTP